MEGVARWRVGRDLWLQSVDVAAVAEQVALQWITAVALFVIELKTTVLKQYHKDRMMNMLQTQLETKSRCVFFNLKSLV